MTSSDTGRVLTRPYMLKGVVFACFVSAGYFKADPRLSWVPVDLTILFGGLSLLLAIGSWWKAGFRVRSVAGWVALLFILFAIPVLWTTWTPYSVEKVLRFFTITMLASLLPFMLFTNKKEMEGLLVGFAAIGLIMAVDAVSLLVMPLIGGSHVDRLTALGSNTIDLGRAAGLSALWFLVKCTEGARKLLFQLLSIGVLMVVMFGSGSRGPLLAFAVCGLIGALFYVRLSRYSWRYLGLAAVAATGVLVGITVSPETSRQRIETFVFGASSTDLSTVYRARAASITVSEINRSPLGSGWGGTQPRLTSLRDPKHGPMVYPHNVVLETFAEGGWFMGIYLLCLLAGTLVSLAFAGLRKDHLLDRIVFFMLLFAVLNSLVSGDLNDNRVLFALLSVGMICLAENRSQSDDMNFVG